jgi:H+/Cl- antiporter ClcA
MTPSKRHQVGAPEIIQFFGLLILIGMDYKYFGRTTHIPLTLSAVIVFATGLFLLIWPMTLKVKQRF